MTPHPVWWLKWQWLRLTVPDNVTRLYVFMRDTTGSLDEDAEEQITFVLKQITRKLEGLHGNPTEDECERESISQLPELREAHVDGVPRGD